MTRGYSVKCLPVPCHIEIFTASLFTPAVLLILILTNHFKNVTDSYMKMKMKIVYSVWQQCMLDSQSHNYNKIQTQIRQ